MQPSLVLSALALSTFFQSSESDQGKFGRDRALRFRDEAQGALEASFNAGWVDETLAQAAWVRAIPLCCCWSAFLDPLPRFLLSSKFVLIPCTP